MSLLGYDNNDKTLTGDADVYAINGYITTLLIGQEQDINVETELNALQAEIDLINIDTSSLQGQINTLNGEVNTLQSEMNTAQSDINTLQSDMNTAQADITALYVTTGTNTTAIAGLSVSQAAQDVTITAHTASIAGLSGDVSVLQGQVTTLQVKTTDQTWGSLTGTTFAGRLNIGTTGAGIVLNQASTSTFGSALTVGTGSGVTLNTASASTFSSGLNSTRTEPLSATSAFQLCDNQTSGFMNIGCNTNRSGGGINIGGGTNNTSPIYINGFCTGNAPITIGSSTSSSQVVAIRGTNLTVGSTNTTTLAFVAAPASNVFFSRNATGGGLYFGNDGASGSNDLYFNIGAGNGGAIRFGTGTAAKTITFGTAAATIAMNGTTTIAGTTNINTTTLSNTTIGNGPAAGNITLNGAINTISGTTNINTTPSTYNTTIGNNTGTMTLNSGILDINANNGITIDGGSTTTVTSINDLTLQTTNPFGDILVSSAGTTTLTSVGQTQINSPALDINATSSGILTVRGGTTNINSIGSSGNTNVGNSTGTLTVTGTTNINGQTAIVGQTYINNTGVESTNIGNSSGILTVTGQTDVNGATTIIGATNINTTGTSATNIGVASVTAGNTTIKGQNITVEAYDSISLEATTGFFSNIGANNFYFRSYNSAPSIIMGSTATDYFSITATSTGTTLDANTQPLTLNGSQVNINNAAMSGANISESTVELISPLAIDATYTTYPITTANRVGRFSSTTSTTKSTTTPTNVISLSIPSQGCYIVEGGFIWSGTFTAEQYSTLSISTTSATLDNTRISVLYLGGAAGGYSNRLTSVVNFSAGGTVYLVGQVPTTLNAATVQSNYMAATRIA